MSEDAMDYKEESLDTERFECLQCFWEGIDPPTIYMEVFETEAYICPNCSSYLDFIEKEEEDE